MDFNLNKSKSLGPNSPYFYDIRSKSTSISSKSPRVNGKLLLRENPYDVTFRQKNGTTCNWGVGDTKHTYMITGFKDNPEISNKLDSLMYTAQKQAIEHAYSKVANVQMSLAETIAERASTLKVIVQRAKQIKTLYNALKQGKLPPIPKGTKKSYTAANKDISGLWLEYSFMWAPLLADIATLVDGIKPIQGIYVKGYSEISDSYNEVNDYYINSQQNGTYYSVFSQRRVRATCKLWVTIDDPLVALQSEMGLLTPVSVWNVMPFSFVVDWFFSVGALFERLCFPGKTITQGSVTTLVDDEVTSYAKRYGRYTTLKDNTIIYYTSVGSGVTVRTQRYYRTVGVPSPFFITTNFSNLSWWNVGTTWALLSSIFSKK